MKLASLIALSLASVASAQTLEAAFRWHVASGGNGHFYRLYSSPGITWGDARSAALSAGGDLASITSLAESQTVYDSLAIASNNSVWFINVVGDSAGPWLGGLQPAGSPEPGGNWQWSDGQSWSFTDWHPGEPNNAGAVEDRVHYFGGQGTRTRQWNDVGLGAPLRGYVVEIVPAPGPAALVALSGLAAVRRRRA